MRIAHNRLDLKGKRFGRLVVTGENEKRPSGKLYWVCICDCGNTKSVETSKLRTGWTSSCGCYKIERAKEYNTKHGMYKTPERKTWQEMKQRCFNNDRDDWDRYGGRGITVCERWLDKDNGFTNFYADMGKRPKGTTLDRIDNNGNYEPSNCRWADDTTQANNKRNNVILVIDGVSDTLPNWCRKYERPRWLVYQRIWRDGEDPKSALTRK